MAFNSHKGTAGHKMATSIMTPDLKQSAGHATGSDPDSQSEGQAMTGFAHIPSIRVSPAANGIAVHHTPVEGPGAQTGAQGIKPESPIEEQMHVFRNAQEAHEHLGGLLGLREGSGSQRS